MRVVVAVVGAALVALSSGCGLRWETPDPEPLVADAAEEARQRGAATAVGLRVVASGASTDDPTVAALLERVAAEAGAHADALGGLAPEPTPTGAPPGEPEVTPPAAPTSNGRANPATALTLLRDGYQSARQDAVELTDGPLARLLASVATARLHTAVELAAALGDTPPAAPQDGPALASTLARTVTADGDPATAVTMTAMHDAAAYAYQVMAARTDETVRERALARAVAHVALADAWATEGVSGTPSDPRQVASKVPEGMLGTPEEAVAAAQRLEDSITEAYATLVATTPPVERLGAVDLMTLMSSAAAAWGGPVPTFPGLPEQR